MGFWAIVGILIGIALGIGLALRMIVLSVKESNDIGDSKGNIHDFGTSLNVIYSEDDLRKLPVSGGGSSLLQNYCNAAASRYANTAK